MSNLDAQGAKDLLSTHFPTATAIDAMNNGNKFEVLIVDDSFNGKRLVQRQQSIYAIFNAYIASGVIHALTIHALTPEEYAARQEV